jgi:hypothetical protein
MHTEHLAESGLVAGQVLFRKKVQAVVNHTSQRGNKFAKLAMVYREIGEICARASNFISPLRSVKRTFNHVSKARASASNARFIFWRRGDLRGKGGFDHF